MSSCLVSALLVAAAPAVAQVLPPEDVVTRQAIIRQLSAPREEHRGLVQVEDQAPGQPSTSTGFQREGPQDPPAISFRNVEFELGSSELSASSLAQLNELASALASEELRTLRFEIAGHTDARGSRAYNQALSKRRAAAVKTYLVRVGGIEPSRLEVVGRGMDRPSRPDDPYAPENRRVEIRNVGAR
jgi:OmpA-OmpF porin, OOP family